ncbi:MAG TPA: glycosyltransferase family 4 protein [Polyangia bacterium]|nr:glycosyltransferase family 4 protein [Polyangia bacterium]
MRVLYLNPFSQEVSGPDESLRALLGALIPAGIEAHVALPAPGPQVDRYEAIGARTHFVPLATLKRALSPATALYGPQLARSVFAVGQLARAVRADIIHTNMEVLLEGGLAARALRIPHVLHYRGNTLDDPKLVFDALAMMWTATADHIYCISRATAGIFERRGRAAKVEVLYNPIDVRAFAAAERSADVRSALGAAPDRVLVGTVGRIHPRKDLETFIRAAALVAARRADVHFTVVGRAEVPIELDHETSLRNLVRDLSLDGRVTFAGARRDMPAVMAALDVFVLTSRHEGFGRVVAEAMASARPLVVTDEGAPPELVEPERYGLVARPADPADFARQIMRQIDDPAGARERAVRAAERARAFDAADTAQRVRSLYERLAPGGTRT